MYNTPAVNPRIALASAGALLILLFLFLGAQRTSFAPLSLGRSGDALLQDVRNQTLGFQKIFVINMPSRTDHRDAMSLAADLTDLQFEYVDGVTHVEDKTIPPHPETLKMGSGQNNAWRAHMNVARLIVEQNLTSALVLEDDADWDIRIKSQMQDFAKASRLLVQPGQDIQREYDIREEPIVIPATSPYGDVNRWDMLWVGHCGSVLPQATEDDPNPSIPTGRVVIRDDKTVPEPQHIRWEYGGDALGRDYPPHTRVVSRAKRGVCTVGYALSQRGARRFLYEMSVNKMWAQIDLMMQNLCDGTDGNTLHGCYGVQPPLFEHHRPRGKKSTWSEISGHGNGMNEEAYTYNVRWSTKLNFPKLVVGDTDYIDLWKDGAPYKNYEHN